MGAGAGGLPMTDPGNWRTWEPADGASTETTEADDDGPVVNWQDGWEPASDDDDPPPPSEWNPGY
jgi:hypothetical protein